jgi:hypothetical protein
VGGFQPTLRLSEPGASDFAYRVGGDPDVSKGRLTAWVHGVLRLTPAITVRMGARGWYDAVYETDQYPPAVRDEFRYDIVPREAFLDVAPSDRLEFAVGRQVVVWGDAVALFFADVFNPKDLREFITWDLADQEIPLLGLTAGYRILPDVRWELAASPEVARIEVAPPGADFAFRRLEPPPGVRVRVVDDDVDDFDVDHGRIGTRLTAYHAGVEGSLFYLAGREELPTFDRRIVTPTRVRVQPVMPLLHRTGGTVAYASRDWVFRAEAVAAFGKRFQTDVLTDLDGLTPGTELDYVVSATRTVLGWDTNVQFFETYRFVGSVPPADPEHETSGSIFVRTDLWNARLEPSLLVVSALDRPSAWVRPLLLWKLTDTWSTHVGADIFLGRDDTLFGQFDRATRITVGLTANFAQLRGIGAGGPRPTP